jgi:hypothetical protein
MAPALKKEDDHTASADTEEQMDIDETSEVEEQEEEENSDEEMDEEPDLVVSADKVEIVSLSSQIHKLKDIKL